MSVTLDRLALDDVGANPRRLAEAIHAQLGERAGAVPVYEIARALDIVEIREEPLTNVEAALLTTSERDCGAILVNSNSTTQRRRFSLGHELGHFLNPWHRPSSADGFWCSRSDMLASEQKASDRHLRQESEANSFSIELLAPRRRVQPFLVGEADIRHVLRLARDLDISREAAVRRYVELHPEMLAVVFGNNGRLIYFSWGRGFPFLKVRRGDPISIVGDGSATELSDLEEVSAEDWLDRPAGYQLTAQTLHQREGLSFTLLRASNVADDDDVGIEDAFDRFSSRNYRGGA